jgi:hypothetical protein
MSAWCLLQLGADGLTGLMQECPSGGTVSSSLPGSGSIFISYRRDETAGYAGRLFDHLAERVGEDRVFMDIDSIALGADFAREVRDAVSGCAAILVLIGRNWLAVTDRTGRRRIDDPDDWVRIEIETALQRDIPVVPILVEGAAMPEADDLPPSLQPLTRRQGLVLSHTGFRSEVSRLIASIGVAEADPSREREPEPVITVENMRIDLVDSDEPAHGESRRSAETPMRPSWDSSTGQMDLVNMPLSGNEEKREAPRVRPAGPSTWTATPLENRPGGTFRTAKFRARLTLDESQHTVRFWCPLHWAVAIDDTRIWSGDDLGEIAPVKYLIKDGATTRALTFLGSKGKPGLFLSIQVDGKQMISFANEGVRVG